MSPSIRRLVSLDSRFTARLCLRTTQLSVFNTADPTLCSNQVAPAELEGHLLEHPLVQNCCVIGIYDERAGEKPKAYVALVPAAKERLAKDPSLAQEFEESIKKHVADVKIHYKRLVAVSFIDVIPINPSGKLLRKECRFPPAPILELRSPRGKFR